MSVFIFLASFPSSALLPPVLVPWSSLPSVLPSCAHLSGPCGGTGPSSKLLYMVVTLFRPSAYPFLGSWRKKKVPRVRGCRLLSFSSSSLSPASFIAGRSKAVSAATPERVMHSGLLQGPRFTVAPSLSMARDWPTSHVPFQSWLERVALRWAEPVSGLFPRSGF